MRRAWVAAALTLGACGACGPSSTPSSVGPVSGATPGSASARTPGPIATFGTDHWRTSYAVWDIAYVGDRVLVATRGLVTFDRRSGERRSALDLDLDRPDALDIVLDEIEQRANVPRVPASALAVRELDAGRVLVMTRTKLAVVELATRKVVRMTEAAGQGHDPLGMSRDRTRVAFRSGRDRAAVWDPTTGAVTDLGTFGRVTGVAIAPDGGAVYVVDDKAVHRIALGAKLVRTTAKLRGGYVVASEQIVAITSGSSVVVLDPRTLAVRATCATGDDVWRLALGPDDQLGWASERQVGVCSAAGANRIVAPRALDKLPVSLAWSPEGDELAVGGDARLELYAVADGRDRADVGHGAPVVAIAIDPTSRHVATGADDGGVEVWELATGKPVRRVRAVDGKAIQALVWTAAGLVISERDGAVWLHGGSDDDIKQLWRNRAGGRFAAALAVSPDGTRLAIDHGSETTTRGVMIVDLRTGEKQLDIAAESSYQLQWGERALWARTGKALLELDPVAGRVRRTLPLPVATTAMAIDERGDRFITCESSGACMVRELATGKVTREAVVASTRIAGLALAPDRTRIFVTTFAGEVGTWQLDEQPPAARKLFPDGLTVLAQSADGATLVLGAYDSTAQVWRAAEVTASVMELGAKP